MGGTVSAQDTNESDDGRDADDAKPGEEDVGAGKRRDRDGARGVVVVNVACPFEANAVEGAVCIALRRNGIEQLNECTLLRDIVWKDRGTSWEAENGGEFGDPKSGVRVRTLGSGAENVGILCGFERAEKR